MAPTQEYQAVFKSYDFFIFNVYLVLVSGVQDSGYTIIYFTKCPPRYFQYLPGTIHSYYTTFYCIPCKYCIYCIFTVSPIGMCLHCYDYFVTTNMYFKKILFYLFLERGGGKKKEERERNIDVREKH